MEDKEKLMQQVKLEIQSLLCTEKGAITSDQLHRMYRSEMGGHVPYMKLGFRSLDELLRNIRDVVSSYTDYADGLLYVKAVPLAGSAHINELVQGQRKAKKKKPAAKSYSSNYAKFKSFRVSSYVDPARNVNRNYNNTYRVPPRFQANMQQGNRANMVPQMMQPRQPTNPAPGILPTPHQPFSQVSTNPAPGILPTPHQPFSQLLRTTPPQNQPAGTTKWSMSCTWGNNNNNNVTKTTNMTPLKSSAEDRSHLKPQPMLPRTPAPSTPPAQPTPPAESAPTTTPESKLMPPSPPESIEETLPSNPVLFQWKPVVSPAFQPGRNPLVQHSGPRNRDPSPTAGLILKPSQMKTNTPRLEQAESLVQQPSLSQAAESLQKSIESLSLSALWKPMEPRPAQQPEPLKEDVPLYPPGVAQPPAVRPKVFFADSPPVAQPSVRPKEPVSNVIFVDPAPVSQPIPASKPAIVPSPVARAPRVLLKKAVPVSRSPEPSRLAPRPVSPPPSPPMARRALSPRKGEMATERLKRLVQTYNLGRVSVNTKQMESTGYYIATIKVGTHKFYTYPSEFADRFEAYECAAKEACAYFEQEPPNWMQPANY